MTANGVNTGGQGRPLYYWHISIGGMRVGAVTATSKTEAIAEARAHWGGDKVARSGRFTARKGKFAGQWSRCKAVKIVKHRNGSVQLLIRK